MKKTICGEIHSVDVMSFEKREYPQKDNGTDNRCDQTTEPAAGSGNSEQAENPTAEDTSDDSDYQIDQKAEPTSAHDFTGNKSGDDTYDNVPNEKHNN